MADNNNNNAGDSQVFTKEDFDKALTERETALKADFETKIKKLNEENAGRRVSEKELKTELAKLLNLGDDKKPEIDVIKASLLEISNKNKELEEKWQTSEKEKTILQKTTEAKELAEKAGLNKTLAVKLIDLNGDIQSQIEKLAADFPELKTNKPNIGSGTPAAGGGNKTFTKEQFDKLSYKERVELFNQNPDLYKQLSKG